MRKKIKRINRKMEPEEIFSELEHRAEEYEGEQLKTEVETLLSESGLDYSQTNVGGLKQPKHKSYTYEIDTDEALYQLDVILWDGRPGHEDGSVNLEEKTK